MEQKRLERIKHIIAIIVIAFAVIFLLFEIRTNLINNNESTAYIEATKWKEDYYDENGEYHHVYEMVIDSDDGKSAYNKDIACILLNEEREKWVDVPLSKEFLKKYENRKILDDDNIIKFSWSDGYHKLLLNDELNLDEKLITRLIECKKTDGDYSYIYNLVIDKNKRIKDIEILSIKKLYDVNTGYTDEYYIKFNENTYLNLFKKILFPSYTKEHQGDIEIDRHNVALSQNFINKYGYDKDVIENSTGVPLTRFKISDEDFDNRTFICTCLYDAKNLWIAYEVKFSLTEDGKLENIAKEAYWLDEIIATYKEEGKRFKDTSKYSNEWDIIRTVVVKNADWSRCPLSKKFLNKYNNKDSILPNYDVRELVFSNKYKTIIDGKMVDLLSIILISGVELPILTKVKWNENKEVDDILIYIIPEDKISLPYEDLYKMAFDE